MVGDEGGSGTSAYDAVGLLLTPLPGRRREDGPDRLVEDVLQTLLGQRRAFQVPASSRQSCKTRRAREREGGTDRTAPMSRAMADACW